ncbi:hypothetical protein CONLIGDRAFT_708983 [Coniochaeta ligniaria NRRL 30616]|uniref:Uncharacterized protein n=1 Tax=Coniochaeta ligniaria NRRL 30616 TaxID=1408157 RepID=A0A1J7IEF9_9PEZI|nr:hypothetical protein CONLIGDRAFT_708983 [Coniochaeta ligniaria NRRL 30616]
MYGDETPQVQNAPHLQIRNRLPNVFFPGQAHHLTEASHHPTPIITVTRCPPSVARHPISTPSAPTPSAPTPSAPTLFPQPSTQSHIPFTHRPTLPLSPPILITRHPSPIITRHPSSPVTHHHPSPIITRHPSPIIHHHPIPANPLPTPSTPRQNLCLPNGLKEETRHQGVSDDSSLEPPSHPPPWPGPQKENPPKRKLQNPLSLPNGLIGSLAGGVPAHPAPSPAHYLGVLNVPSRAPAPPAALLTSLPPEMPKLANPPTLPPPSRIDGWKDAGKKCC